ncbi:MAG TPA: alkaline phosphatase family protein [Prolixibacteraceae bacterium]|nr:alkaline phosphatase family protein [Prolixibacteraceae bacterium]
MKNSVVGVLLFSLFFIHPLWAQQNKFDAQPPKVVIGLVVENMRPDYIHRYWNEFLPNGFRKLYSNGTVCTNVNLTQHAQSYASGTATLFTGATPSIHGIINKTWYSRLKEKEVESTEDDYYITVGSDSEFGKASPVKLLSNTVTDNLKIFTRGKAKVFSAAMNRESSIFSAGHAADGAYWYDPQTGRMISSSFYISNFPEWVRLFNNENYGQIYSYRNWTALLPSASYEESTIDDYILEKGYYDSWNTFPHNISKYSKRAENFGPLKTTPFANLIIKDFAKKLMDNEEIGQDNVTDFLTFTFSSMDYENGSFGPASMEMQDSYLYLDQYLAELISYAEQKYGKGNVLFFLTSNTSASYPVEYLQEEFHLPVDHYYPENSIALLTSYLNITYGQQKWIAWYSDLQVYLDHELIKKNNVDLNEMRDEASNFINQFEAVQVAMPAYQLEQGNPGNEMLGPLYNSYAKNRSGDFLYTLKEGWQPKHKFQRTNYTDESHIPLVFYGKGIPAIKISTKYNAVDLAPTLSELMGIQSPNKSQGQKIDGLTD